MSGLRILNKIKDYALQKAKLYWLSARYPGLIAAFRVKSHLAMDERVKLYNLSRNLNSVAEIGSYIGASACCFGASMKYHK